MVDDPDLGKIGIGTDGGLGFGAGAGYDFRMGKNFSLTPYVNYLLAAEADLKYERRPLDRKLSFNQLQIGLGFTWH